MLSSRICIVARSMSRISDGAKRTAFIALLLIGALLGSGCEGLEGRQKNRKGNLLFREMQFIDAVSEYEGARKYVKDEGPAATIHYNLGHSYSKMYRPGYEKSIRLGEITDPVCASIPGSTKTPTTVTVCVKKV